LKILILTQTGTALGIAQRLAQEGHEIEVYSDGLTHTGGSMYTISKNILKSIQQCKFIVADGGNWGNVYKQAKMYNRAIIGCNTFTDQLNADSLKEYDLGSRLGVSYPKSEIYNDAVGLQPRVLEGTKKRYYVKYKRRVFSCTKPEWLAWAMYQLPPDQKVLLQEEVLGHDISVVGWFNGLEWVKPFFYCTPYSDKINGVAMLSQKRETRLTIKTLAPLDKWLRVIDYKGPVTANLIVNNKDTFVRNFYIGLTSPSIFAMIEGLKTASLASFLNGLAFSMEQEVDVTFDYLVGVGVSNKDPDMRGAPILGVDKGNIDHIFFHGVYKDKDSYLISDEFNHVYTAVAHGRDMKEATNRVYSTIDKVQFPNMAYMSNLLGQTSVTFNKLKSWSII